MFANSTIKEEVGMKYDYLIAGAGFFGAIFAQKARENGKTCLVIDKRPHIAGNAYTEEVDGILVHKYGAHIFHTSDKTVWGYVNRFCEFNHYINSPVAKFKNELYNLPFNMNTFSKLWNISTPQQAKDMIEKQRKAANVTTPQNLEEQALFLVGSDIYEKLIKGYTEKQWGRDCRDLPAFIINRLPLRFVYDNNYFNDRYQGIPIGGYTRLVQNILGDTEVKLNTDYFDFIKENPDIARKIVYTGAIDEFFEYCCGELEYRSLRFETQTVEADNYQGNAVVNYTEREVPYTRIIEHKHFEFGAGNPDKTVITKEYPQNWQRGDEPYYPVNNAQNNSVYEEYYKLSQSRPDVIFGGRLGKYKYFDMDKVIADALTETEKEFKN
jgi:UDP-galactopyranose mutase